MSLRHEIDAATDTLQSYRDASGALHEMEVAGCMRSRHVARTHLDRAIGELRNLGSGWAGYFEEKANEVEADRRHAEQLDRECAQARAEGGIDAVIAVLTARLRQVPGMEMIEP